MSGKLYKVTATFEVIVLAENKENAEYIAKDFLESDRDEKTRTCTAERVFFIGEVPVDWRETIPLVDEDDQSPELTVSEILQAEENAMNNS